MRGEDMTREEAIKILTKTDSVGVRLILSTDEKSRKHNAESIEALNMAIKALEEQPKTGHWKKTISENGITSAVRCSECGFEDNRYMLFRYCPNCGAKME